MGNATDRIGQLTAGAPDRNLLIQWCVAVDDALARELLEEGGIALTGAPELRSLHHNRGRDHVAFYVVRDFAQAGPRQPDWEIAEAGFFAPDALPEGATRATRERLAEIFGGAEVSATW